jgi:UDP-glucose 4-epimerase
MSGNKEEPRKRSVLVTGASGYIGRLTVQALARDPGRVAQVTALDLRPVPREERIPGVLYETMDITSPDLLRLLRDRPVDVVVHLAAIVSPPKRGGRELSYRVDVLGTRNVLDACLESGVGHLVVTSSGAAYGYHPDSPEWLTEDDPLRGNEEFAYSHHKRLIEEMLAETRREHPQLRQLVFRPGTILGESASNQITALFEKPVVLGLLGVETPFVLVWDEDVVGAILEGVHTGKSGIFNLAGDGTVTLRQIARGLGKAYLPLPVKTVRAALSWLHWLGLSQYGPEQVVFLEHRPVLSNDRLKTGLGYLPRKTSAEVFELYRRSRA